MVKQSIAREWDYITTKIRQLLDRLENYISNNKVTEIPHNT